MDKDTTKGKIIEQKAAVKARKRYLVINRIKNMKRIVIVDIDSFTIDYLNYITIVDLCEKYKISSATIFRLIKEKKIKKRGYKCNKTE